MIFGDSGCGKSTLANKLGDKLNLPVFHADEITNKFGRDKSKFKLIEKEIIKKAKQPKWVFDGNAFNKDKEFRIIHADKIIMFDFPGYKALFYHLIRCFESKLFSKKIQGGNSNKLNLSSYIPYIFWKFPKKKKMAIDIAQQHNKEIIQIKYRKDIQKLLNNLDSILS